MGGMSLQAPVLAPPGLCVNVLGVSAESSFVGSGFGGAGVLGVAGASGLSPLARAGAAGLCLSHRAPPQRGLAGPWQVPGQGRASILLLAGIFLSCSAQAHPVLNSRDHPAPLRHPVARYAPDSWPGEQSWDLPSFLQDRFTAVSQLHPLSVPTSPLRAHIPSPCPCPLPVPVSPLHAHVPSPCLLLQPQFCTGSRRMTPGWCRPAQTQLLTDILCLGMLSAGSTGQAGGEQAAAGLRGWGTAS